MINNLIWLNFFIFPSFYFFLFLSILFFISLYVLNNSIKDLIVDYLPSIFSTLGFWCFLILCLGGTLFLGLFIM